MTFAEEMVQLAIELLTEFGVPASITSAASGLDPNTLLPASGSVIGTALVVSFTPGRESASEASMDEEAIRKRRWFYVQSDADLGTRQIVQIGSESFLVEDVKRVMAQNTTVYYEIVTTKVS